MAEETVRLAEYAAALRYEDLPAAVVQQAKDCIIDTVAAAICGAALPWSRIVIDYAERTGPGGKAIFSAAAGRRCRRRRRRSPMARSRMRSSSTV